MCRLNWGAIQNEYFKVYGSFMLAFYNIAHTKCAC